MTKKEQKRERERVSGRVPAGINRIDYMGERGLEKEEAEEGVQTTI